jgi:hypothetical protein
MLEENPRYNRHRPNLVLSPKRASFQQLTQIFRNIKFEAIEICLIWEIRIVGSGIYDANQTIVVFFCLKSLLDVRYGPENRV